MKKQIVLLGAFFLILIISGCGKKVSETGEPISSTGDRASTEAQKKETGDGSFSGSIKELIAKGDSMQCTFSLDAKNEDLKGTVYVSGDKFFQNFSMAQPEGGNMQVFSLSDGQWIYQWNSLSNMGTKIKLEEVEKNNDMATKMVEESSVSEEVLENKLELKGNDFNTKNEYSCQKWSVDNTKFQLPEGISFNDFSQLLNNLPKANDSGTTNPCQICSSLPAEAKTACLESCSK